MGLELYEVTFKIVQIFEGYHIKVTTVLLITQKVTFGLSHLSRIIDYVELSALSIRYPTNQIFCLYVRKSNYQRDYYTN